MLKYQFKVYFFKYLNSSLCEGQILFVKELEF